MDVEKDEELKELAKFFFRKEDNQKRVQKEPQKFKKELADKAEELGLLDALLEDFTLKDYITSQIIHSRDIKYWIERYSDKEG